MKGRRLTLLEVLIAMTLILCCFLPLIRTNAALGIADREFGQAIDDDLAVSNFFAGFYERALRGEVEVVVDGEPVTIDELPWASYLIKVDKEKNDDKKTVYLLQMVVSGRDRLYNYPFVAVKSHEKESVHTH